MRHSDANLTLGICTHAEMSEFAGAVEKLPKNLIDRRPETTDSGFSCTKNVRCKQAISLIMRGGHLG